MSRSLFLLLGLTTLLPLAIEAPMDSSTTDAAGTRIRISGGVGYYAFIARGCGGEVLDKLPVHMRDASVSLEQRLPGVPLSIGARGGWLRDQIDTSSSLRFPTVPIGQTVHNRYLNLFVSLETRDNGVGLGYVFHDHEFITAGESARNQRNHPLNDVSFHARFGRLDGPYFLAQWMESEPLYSGGGYVTVGAGDTGPSPRFHGFIGMGAGGPYEGAAALARIKLDLSSASSLHFAGRLGPAGNDMSWGVSLGLEVSVPTRSGPPGASSRAP